MGTFLVHRKRRKVIWEAAGVYFAFVVDRFVKAPLPRQKQAVKDAKALVTDVLKLVHKIIQKTILWPLLDGIFAKFALIRQKR